MSQERFVRINGSIHLNHIEAKHGTKNFEKIIEPLLTKGLRCFIINNRDRHSPSSIILSVYGEIETTWSLQKYSEWMDTLVNNLQVPVESAIFDLSFVVHPNDEPEQHFYALSLTTGKLKKVK